MNRYIIRMDRQLTEKIDAVASGMGLSRAAFMRMATIDYIERKEKAKIGVPAGKAGTSEKTPDSKKGVLHDKSTA